MTLLWLETSEGSGTDKYLYEEIYIANAQLISYKSSGGGIQEQIIWIFLSWKQYTCYSPRGGGGGGEYSHIFPI